MRIARNLPTQPTALIGRGREIAAVAALLQRADVRLVTLAWPPAASARPAWGSRSRPELLDDFLRMEATVVNLAPISDPNLVATTIARARPAEVAGRPVEEGLHAFLRAKRTLLLLDG